MMLEGDWLVQQLADGGNLDDYGIFPFPTGTDRLYGFAEYNYVSSRARTRTLAAKFLDYFISTAGAAGHARPVRDHVGQQERQVREPAAARRRSGWTSSTNYSKVFMNGDQAFPLDVTTEYFRVINEVASGQHRTRPTAAAAAADLHRTTAADPPERATAPPRSAGRPFGLRGSGSQAVHD